MSRLIREQVAGGDIAIVMRGGQDPEFLIDLIAERDQGHVSATGQHLKTILLGLRNLSRPCLQQRKEMTVGIMMRLMANLLHRELPIQ